VAVIDQDQSVVCSFRFVCRDDSHSPNTKENAAMTEDAVKRSVTEEKPTEAKHDETGLPRELEPMEIAGL
jgi:hypothetical protein